jgi:hypothetical protein
MRSVADDLREERRRAVLAMEPLSRIELALRLGDEDTRIFATARCIPEADARRELARRRQSGRRESKSKRR